MGSDRIFTQFAPAERAAPEEIASQTRLIQGFPLLSKLYDAVAESVAILNRERQIVFCNDKFVNLLDIRDPSAVYGLRPGEALRCAYAAQSSGGCGTTEHCSQCGAAKSIIASQRGDATASECSILQGRQGDAMELLVSTSPFELDGRQFTIFSATDISDRKRRVALERTFFHDILNTAGSILSLCELHDLERENRNRDKIIGMISKSSERLVEEIKSQRGLLAAEMNTLAVNVDMIFSLPFLIKLVQSHVHFGNREACSVVVSSDSENISFQSDKTLLSRVLVNMIKNASEASGRGDTITVGCGRSGENIEFWVKNPAVIPREVQLQLFQRSFSTKGPGRGLGTYGMKLLTERYLKGAIEFFSSEGEGTVFKAAYPLSFTVISPST